MMGWISSLFFFHPLLSVFYWIKAMGIIVEIPSILCRDGQQKTKPVLSCPVLFPDGLPWLVAIHRFSFPVFLSFLPPLFLRPLRPFNSFLFCSQRSKFVPFSSPRFSVVVSASFDKLLAKVGDGAVVTRTDTET